MPTPGAGAEVTTVYVCTVVYIELCTYRTPHIDAIPNAGSEGTVVQMQPLRRNARYMAGESVRNEYLGS